MTLAAGDTVNLLPNVGIFNHGTSGSSGIQAGGSNSFILDGDVFSRTGSGIVVLAGNNDINIGAASMVRGQAVGIFVDGSNSAIGVAGEVVGATGRAIEIFGQNNTINVLTGGEVFGENDAIRVNGNGSNMITVAGTATGRNDAAILLNGGSNVVTIAGIGTVIGQTIGVNFVAGGTGANQVVNHGWLQGTGEAVRTQQDGTVITNTGTMIGGIGCHSHHQ